LCLQETKLSLTSQLTLKHYSAYHTYCNSASDNYPSGGVTTFVRHTIQHRSLSLNTPLQAQAIVVTLDQAVTICNLYLPLNTNVNFSDLDNLLQQLPTPCLILGDFNAYHLCGVVPHKISKVI